MRTIRVVCLFAFLILGFTLAAAAPPAERPRLKDSAPPMPDAEQPVRIALDVTKDTKILVNGKSVTFAKFAVIIEYAADAFDVDEAIYKDRQFTSLKLVSRGK
jgi:hypothetical protein